MRVKSVFGLLILVYSGTRVSIDFVITMRQKRFYLAMAAHVLCLYQLVL
jgi:hypothetical protein